MRIDTTGRIAAMAMAALLIFCVAGVGLGQELGFCFDVALDGALSGTYMFGLADDALPGLDDHDLPNPPPAPDAPFSVYLAMFEPPGGMPNQWLYDFRPSGNLLNDRIELWQMDLTAAATGGLCTITVAVAEPAQVPFKLIPYKLNFFGPGADFTDITIPGSISFAVSSPFLVFFWELRLSDEVDVVNVSWGGVKSLYH